MADKISQLPMDYNSPSEQDLKVMNALFGNSKINSEVQKLLIPGILFFVLSIPYFDKLLGNFVTTSSNYVLLAIKTIIFIILLLIIQLIFT
jgi:hypothetical protein